MFPPELLLATFQFYLDFNHGTYQYSPWRIPGLLIYPGLRRAVAAINADSLPGDVTSPEVGGEEYYHIG